MVFRPIFFFFCFSYKKITEKYRKTSEMNYKYNLLLERNARGDYLVSFRNICKQKKV